MTAAVEKCLSFLEDGFESATLSGKKIILKKGYVIVVVEEDEIIVESALTGAVVCRARMDERTRELVKKVIVNLFRIAVEA